MKLWSFRKVNLDDYVKEVIRVSISAENNYSFLDGELQILELGHDHSLSQ